MDITVKKKIELREIYPIIKEKLAEGGTVELPITGTSMLPLLVAGRDTVDIVNIPPKNGDIIFYRRDDGHFVLHRIVGETERGFILCGDNQYKLEYGIEARHIIGVVSSVNRKGRKTDVNTNKPYKAYCSVWRAILPVRKYPIIILSKFRALKSKLKSPAC